jgi:hypothetical protein
MMAAGCLFGMQVVISPDVPKMRLSRDCPVSPEFRLEMNDWMLSFFGTTNLVADGQVFKTPDTLHMNPRTWEQLKSQVMQ